MFKSLVLVPYLFLVTASMAPVHAQREPGQLRPTEDLDPAKFQPPTTFRQAVDDMEHRLHLLVRLLEAKDRPAIQTQNEVFSKVAHAVGPLALKEGSGVPKDAVEEVSHAAKELALKFDAAAKAEESGGSEETKKAIEEMLRIAEMLSRYIPKARHGGIFFASADSKHHVEATLYATGEFRIYFYDEYGKPISAEKFSAAGKVSMFGAGASDRQSLALGAGPQKAYLLGRVDSRARPPVTVQAFINFKNGKPPQPITFDFKESTKRPMEETPGGGGP